LQEFKPVLCSKCFKNEGLKLDAKKIGKENNDKCPNCGLNDGAKLDQELTARLAHRFFVRGSFNKTNFGGAPVIQFNQRQETSIDVSNSLQKDIHLFENTIDVGFFYYGPRLWMVGEVEPLKSLQKPSERESIIQRILEEYPNHKFTKGSNFYRLRKNPNSPNEIEQYDSPPEDTEGNGRLDSNELKIMYGSQDLEICIHECRVTVEDEIFFATLAASRDLKLLNLTEVIHEDTTEFQSLDLAIHMLFLAEEHSYEITREIAISAHKAGYDGIIYPSYYSLLRTGSIPFDTIYGISIRKIPDLEEHAKSQIIPNIALFGRPIEEGNVNVECINKAILNQVNYDLQFGPAKY